MAETRCGTCRYYIELPVPYKYEKDGYPDGITVYGFCTKATQARGVFFPVYIPDGGVCKDYKKSYPAKKKTANCDMQMELGGY